MPIGSFFSSFHFGDDDILIPIINPIDYSKITYADAIKGFE